MEQFVTFGIVGLSTAAIYAIIGVLALKLAIGEGGKLTDQQGALKTVAGQPFGSILLTLLAIGLGGYSLWRLFRAAPIQRARPRESSVGRAGHGSSERSAS